MKKYFETSDGRIYFTSHVVTVYPISSDNAFTIVFSNGNYVMILGTNPPKGFKTIEEFRKALIESI